jgi:glycosyltransferase involved in cell wall biosynthesis
MRILHVIQELGLGGAERVTLSLVCGAHAAGHDVQVAAADGALAAELPSPVHPLPLLERRLRRFPRAAARLAAVLRVERPDLVHAHNPAMALLVALAAVRRRRLPALVSVHGFAERDDRIATRVLRLSRLPIVACGPAIEDALRAQAIPVVAMISNGLPSAPAPANPAAARRAWGVEQGQALVLSVGRLVPDKDHSVAVSAMARLPNAVLAIVGSGPDEARLRSHALAEGVSDRVIFAGPRSDAWSLMGAADAVVLTSRAEGMPLTVLEALAIGAPLIATSVRGVSGLVSDGETAILVPPDDEAALASGVSRVLTDKDLARRLRAAGKQLARTFDESSMTAAYLELYARIASARV